jgi:hypothetical protein
MVPAQVASLDFNGLRVLTNRPPSCCQQNDWTTCLEHLPNSPMHPASFGRTGRPRPGPPAARGCHAAGLPLECSAAGLEDRRLCGTPLSSDAHHFAITNLNSRHNRAGGMRRNWVTGRSPVLTLRPKQRQLEHSSSGRFFLLRTSDVLSRDRNSRATSVSQVLEDQQALNAPLR